MPRSNRDRVEDVLLDYCESVDAGDVEGVLALFAPDAVVDYGFGRDISGHVALREFFAERLVKMYVATSHHISNVRITVDDDAATTTATSRCYAYAWHQRRDGTQAHIWGRYIDRLAVIDGSWRLVHRTIRGAGSSGFNVPEGSPGPFQLIDRVGRVQP